MMQLSHFIFYFKKKDINTFIQQGHIKLIKSDHNDMFK